MQIRCKLPDISYLSETQKNNFQFLNRGIEHCFSFIIIRKFPREVLKTEGDLLFSAIGLNTWLSYSTTIKYTFFML